MSRPGFQTPALLIDEARFEHNVRRMNTRLDCLDVPLRPHLKTVKNIDLARRMLAGHPGGATVSTLAEADHFFAAGIDDLLYAVGIAPGKLDDVARRIRLGMTVTLILDHPEAARAVADAAERLDMSFRVLLEVDADGHRAGFPPDDPALIESARILERGGALPAGVMVHAGGSYTCRNRNELVRSAEQERDVAVAAADALRDAGFEAPVVSVGSTPTALFAEDLTGVTEVRAGVYAFMDLVMAGLGVCGTDDIAVSVLSEVIGHRRRQGEVLIDAGWMALSRDRGTAEQRVDYGYGRVCDEAGQLLPADVIVRATNQEHGIVARRDGEPLDLALISRSAGACASCRITPAPRPDNSSGCSCSVRGDSIGAIVDRVMPLASMPRLVVRPACAAAIGTAAIVRSLPSGASPSCGTKSTSADRADLRARTAAGGRVRSRARLRNTSGWSARGSRVESTLKWILQRRLAANRQPGTGRTLDGPEAADESASVTSFAQP